MTDSIDRLYSHLVARPATAALVSWRRTAPGAEEIRNVLTRVFAGRVGVPGTVTAKARSGRLKPTLLKLR